MTKTTILNSVFRYVDTLAAFMDDQCPLEAVGAQLKELEEAIDAYGKEQRALGASGSPLDKGL